jgi:hypothetical protein
VDEAINDFPSGITLASELLAGVGIVAMLLIYGAWSFPESTTRGGRVNLGVSLAVLLVYGAVSEWARRSSSCKARLALVCGARVGLLIGLIEVVNHWLESFGDLRSPLPGILGVSMWGVLFLCFGAAASATYQKLGSFRLSVVASVWSAMVSTVALMLFGMTLTLLYMPHMQVVLAGDFAASGMTDPRAFVVRNLIDAASSHLLIAPGVAAIAGIFSTLIGVMLRSIGRRTLALLACSEVLVLAVGIMAIRFASSLDRSARPPYIMCGLLALGGALAAAYPVASAIRYKANATVAS